MVSSVTMSPERKRWISTFPLHRWCFLCGFDHHPGFKSCVGIYFPLEES